MPNLDPFHNTRSAIDRHPKVWLSITNQIKYSLACITHLSRPSILRLGWPISLVPAAWQWNGALSIVWRRNVFTEPSINLRWSLCHAVLLIGAREGRSALCLPRWSAYLQKSPTRVQRGDSLAILQNINRVQQWVSFWYYSEVRIPNQYEWTDTVHLF